MDRLEQVFVSSTYLDLVDERREVMETLLEADCIPAGMELFPASSDDQWTLIQRVIDNCDYYIVVVGGRYGSVDSESGLSYTEKEYDYAVEIGLPVMGFLHGDPGKIELDKSDLDTEAREALAAFRAKVEQRMCKYWRSPAELGGHVAKSLIQTRKTHPAIGWVRGDRVQTPETLQEMAELRQSVAELKADLAKKARATQPALKGLARGEEAFRVDYRVVQDSMSVFGERNVLFEGHLLPTWDELIGVFGPSLFDEMPDSSFREILDRYVRSLVNVPKPSGIDQIVIELEPVQIDTLKVQFKALGVIELGTKKRPVSDARTYWKLSEFGEQYLLNLRSVATRTVE